MAPFIKSHVCLATFLMISIAIDRRNRLEWEVGYVVDHLLRQTIRPGFQIWIAKILHEVVVFLMGDPSAFDELLAFLYDSVMCHTASHENSRIVFLYFI